MSKLSYDGVDVLIYDPVSSNRTATRAALYSLGFRRTETVPTLEAFTNSVLNNPPDIAICETQGASEELCAVIQQMRHGGGYNPFIVIIVTAWQKSSGLIHQVVSSGADDLLLRPFSTATLGQRIKTHIQRRKHFVITSDYVGPDRRKENHRIPSAERFEPPNSLKMKALEKLSGDMVAHKLDEELKTAREKLLSEKLRRDALQICVLWRLMQEQPNVGAQPKGDLTKLQKLTKSIESRCRDNEQPEALEWCESLLAAAEALVLGVDRNASMHLLGHAALSLHQLFHPEKTAADQLSEVDATVAVVKTRQRLGRVAV